MPLQRKSVPSAYFIVGGNVNEPEQIPIALRENPCCLIDNYLQYSAKLLPIVTPVWLVLNRQHSSTYALHFPTSPPLFLTDAFPNLTSVLNFLPPLFSLFRPQEKEGEFHRRCCGG